MQDLCEILAKVLGDVDYIPFQYFLSLKSHDKDVAVAQGSAFDSPSPAALRSAFCIDYGLHDLSKYEQTLTQAFSVPCALFLNTAAMAEAGAVSDGMVKTSVDNMVVLSVEGDRLAVFNCAFSKVKLKGHYKYRDIDTVYDQFYRKLEEIQSFRDDKIVMTKVARTDETEKLMSYFLDFMRAKKHPLLLPFENVQALVIKESTRTSLEPELMVTLTLETGVATESFGDPDYDLPKTATQVSIVARQDHILHTVARLVQDSPKLQALLSQVPSYREVDSSEEEESSEEDSDGESGSGYSGAGSDGSWSPFQEGDVHDPSMYGTLQDPLEYIPDDAGATAEDKFFNDEVEEISKLLLALDPSQDAQLQDAKHSHDHAQCHGHSHSHNHNHSHSHGLCHGDSHGIEEGNAEGLKSIAKSGELDNAEDAKLVELSLDDFTLDLKDIENLDFKSFKW